MLAVHVPADDRRWNQATLVMLALVMLALGLFTVA